MSLNDEALADLKEDTIVDNDVIDVPSITPKAKLDITIIPETSEVPALTEISEDVLDKLPEASVAFKLVEDNVSKTVELQNVQSQIENQDSINKSGAQYVSQSFEGFFEGPVKVNYFTESLSKTNLDYTLKFMRTKIAKEHEAIVSGYENLLESPLKDTRGFYTKLKDNYIPGAEKSSFEMLSLSSRVKEHLDICKDIVFVDLESKGKFINIVSTDLRSFSFSSLENIQADKESLDKARETLLKCFDCGTFKNMFMGSLMNKGLLDILDGNTTEKETIDIGDILEFYMNGNIANLLSSIVSFCDEKLKVLEKYEQDSQEHKTQFDTIVKYLSDNGKEIRACFDDINRLYSGVNSFNMFNASANVLLSFYTKL